MSEPKRLNTDGAVKIMQHRAVGMVTIRADLSDKSVVKSIEEIVGLPLPLPRKISGGVHHGLAWMSPDELLLFCPKSKNAKQFTADLTAAISGHSLCVDVSHARAVFALSGPAAREVFAKGAPVDMARDAFTPSDFRRTRLGQVAVAFWLEDATADQFGLVSFASVQEFVFDWLVNAAQKGSLPAFLI